MKSAETKRRPYCYDGKNKSGRQNLYYRLSIYDDAQNRAANFMPMVKIERPVLSEEERIQMRKIWELSELQRGDKVQKAILTVNQELSSPTMSPVLPLNHTSKEFAEKVMQILAYKRIPARIAWTIKLEEGKKQNVRILCWKLTWTGSGHYMI